MKDGFGIFPQKTALSVRRVNAAFAKIHAQRARTLTGLTGTLIMLPMVLQAQEGGTVALSELDGVQSFDVLDDGSVRVTLSDGRSFVVSASEVVTAGDQVVVTAQAAQEISALAAVEGAAGAAAAAGAAGGTGAAAAGLIGVAGLAAAGGGGGGGGGSGPNLTSKTLTIVDAPLEEALVFYDSNGNETPEEVEYLGVTDAEGAIDVEYEPAANGSFLIIPAPVVNGDDYGWSNDFQEEVADFVTRDVVTDNIFNTILQAGEAGDGVDQVVSPLSTLVAAGVPEETVKEVFGLSEETDIDTFNFFETLSDENSTPEQLAEAKAASAAAIAAVAVVSASLSAAQAQKQAAEGETQELTAQEIAEVTARAVDVVARVVQTSADTGANLELEDIGEIATAVAVTQQLNSDTVDEEDVTDIVSDVIADAQGGGDVSGSVTNKLQELQDSGEIGEDSANTAGQSAAAVKTGTQAVKTVLENNNPTDEGFEQTLAAQLDEADDETDAAVNEVVNRELLGIELGLDVRSATEGSDALLKGNLLSNDKFSDGTAIPAATQIVSVNGRAIADSVTYSASGTIETADFLISTADRVSSWAQSGGRTVSNEVIEGAISLNAELPSAAVSGFAATFGSAITGQLVAQAGDTITFDYSFGSEDYLPWNDYSFFAVQEVDGNGDAVGAGEVFRNDSGTAGDAPLDVRDLKGPIYYTLAGTWSVQDDTYQYTFDEAGTYNFAFGVTDVGDRIFDTYVWVKDIDTDATLVGGAVEELGNVSGELTQGTIQVPDAVSATLITGFYGSLIVQEDGDYLYQVGGANADDVAPGVTVTDNFTYKVETPSGRVASQQLKVQITGIDEGPSVVTLQASDANAENADGYTISGTLQNVTGDIAITITQVGVSDPVSITIPAEDIEIEDGEGVVGFVAQPDLDTLPDGVFEVRVNYTDADGEPQTVAQQAELDTIADADAQIAFEAVVTPSGDLLVDVDNLDDDASAVLTVSVNGGDPVEVEITDNGVFNSGLTGVAFDAPVTVAYEITDNAGNTAEGEETFNADTRFVLNVEQGSLFTTLQEAVDAANEGETLQLAGGHVFNEDVVIDKSLTIEGANAGNILPNDPAAIPAAIEALDLTEDVFSVVSSIRVAAPDVRIDGVVFGTEKLGEFFDKDLPTSDQPPLSWDADAPDGVDGFTLANSLLVGYDASDAPTFGDVVNPPEGPSASGWSFSGNIIGGVSVSSNTGGSLKIAGVEDLSITDNMFWRPGAGHVYLTSVSDVLIEDNFFYHGVHAGGANLDGFLDTDARSIGGGSGYGYGFGYGYGTIPTDNLFLGRNMWVEFKGENSDVTIQGNDGQYNSGGIQLFGEEEGASFDNFLITDNAFRDFINADPAGLLGEGRATSGFMGAVAVSVVEGSSASNIVITDNTITAALDQVYSERDQFSLISVQGNVEDVTTTGNNVTWVAESSAAILAELQALGVEPSSYATGVEASEGVVTGFAYIGGISGALDIQGNTISESMGSEGSGVFVAIYIDGDGLEFDGANFEGDMTAIITETGNTLNLNGQNAIPVLATFTENFAFNDVEYESAPAFFATDLDGDDVTELYTINGGTEGNDNISMSTTREFIVGQEGFDNIDVDGGSAIVAIQFGLDGEDFATITNFTAGAPGEEESDFIPFFLTNGFELRGESFQVYGTDGVVEGDTGVLLISEPGGLGEQELATLFDQIDDQESIVLVYETPGGTRVEAFGGDGVSEGGGALLGGISADALSAETFLIEQNDLVTTPAEV